MKNLILISTILFAAQSFADTCSLSAPASCSSGVTVSGIVSITADPGHDIQLDGVYIGTNSAVWDTRIPSGGIHTLTECANVTTPSQCSQVWQSNYVWVPNLVWVPNYVWVSQPRWVEHWVWVSDIQCYDYDWWDGYCYEYVDYGYYEDNGYWTYDGTYVDQGYYQDRGSYVDRGQYVTQCTQPSTQYQCKNPINVTIQSPYTLALSQPSTLMEVLYVGYFGRAADPAGLDYWVSRYAAGMKVGEIAASFSVQVESRGLYPFLANPNAANVDQFITQVYRNLLNREPDSGGLAYWHGQLMSNLTPQGVGMFIINVVYGARLEDQQTIANKVNLALFETNGFRSKGINNVSSAPATPAYTLSFSTIAATNHTDASLTAAQLAFTAGLVNLH